ncbi:MAG: EF-hand domain-containing protein [Gallionella sp.]|nr:EF-hand domain-containing protein [Gallionella sp.]
MKKTINCLVFVSCFTFGAALAHADPRDCGEPPCGRQMHGAQMYRNVEDKMFKEADTNGDGKITREEMQAAG